MKLRDYLYKNHIDPVEFSKLTGVSVPSIYRYMRGRTANLRIAYKIEKLTGGEVTIHDLGVEK